MITQQEHSNIHLRIYISSDCATCHESRKIYQEIQPQFPLVNIRLIDLSENVHPAHIFAVPTYELNGKIISMGNPTRKQLHSILQEALES